MTNEFQYLMHLLSTASIGIAACKPEKTINWQKLIMIAEEQKVLPLIAYTISRFENLTCPQALCEHVTTDMKKFAVRNYIKRCRVVSLLDDMRKDGIEYLLLKGYVVADEYFVSDCRISSDTDILVNPVDEQRVCSYLSKRGFGVARRSKNGHHSICFHPDIGIIEVHIRLFDKIVEDVWFEGIDKFELIQETYRQIKVDDVYCPTLGHTDHIIYLAMHMVKHFIISGLSLSIIIDMAVYFKTNNRYIDTKRFWMMMSRFKCDVLVSCVLTAAIKYMNFHPEHFTGIAVCNDELVEMLITDLETGGWLGKKDKRVREAGWHEYNRRKLMKGHRLSHYIIYMFRWLFGEFCYELFPSQQQLLKCYPFLQSKPWLFPYAWINRVFIRGFRSLISGDAFRRLVLGKGNGNNKIGSDRVHLFEKLNMM